MKPHLCELHMTFDTRSRCFWTKSDTSWKYPAKIFVRRSIFHRNTIYRSVNIEVNWSLQISAHKEDGVSFSLLFLCASQKMHRLRHEKRTDKLLMRQQSIYCVKNARNALSRKHCTKSGPPSARQRKSFKWRFAGVPMMAQGWVLAW